MQNCPILPLGCTFSAVLGEGLGHIHITPFRCSMQQCRPVLPLGCRIGAVLNEEPGHIHMTP